MSSIVVKTQVDVADEVWTGKVVRDGKVAVLYSPTFGAGWSTWDHEYGEALVFDPMLVKYVEEENVDAMYTYVAMRYPNVYTGGLSDLTISWIKEGTLFHIEEYDGSESIATMDSTGWIRA
jgi:hypothetical protein